MIQHSLYSFRNIATGIFLLFTTFATAQSRFPFQDTSLGFEQRVNDLVSRLTLEEKVAQMQNTTPAIERLGIPAYDWWNEVLHGVARTPYKVTVFPQAIAMAATFDTSSIRLMAEYSAMEGRAIYNKAMKDGRQGKRYVGLTYWTPNINIFRDPRWGRGQETYGEDPFLTAMMGKAFVHGLQGRDPKYLLAAACAKHYAVHSGPEPARHAFNVSPSGYDLWNTYLPAFKTLVADAKVAGVMCAYNAFRTQPCCGSDPLMTDILRNRWQFTGYVTSDCGAIDDFFNFHKTHPNAESAAADALLHGTDVDCGNVAYKRLVQAVKDKLITEQQVDVSLKRLFMIRFRLGFFDPVSAVPYGNVPESELESPEHKAHSLKMAQQSIVLLKNDRHTLPLSKNIRKIAVVGPNADNAVALLGNYNGTPSEIVTVLQGIKNKLPHVEVMYQKVIDHTDDSLQTDMNTLATKLKDADAIVFVGGISPQLEGEEMRVNHAGFKGGDRTSILLPAVQTRLLKALKATGKPVVFVMMTGSAIATPWESENIPAIVNAWYGGQSAGTAIANVLFGDYNPSGRLPVTFYKGDQDLPSFDDYAMTNRTYRYFKGKPLYAFGHGLSYTSFRYSNLQLIPNKNSSTITVRATVKNTGSRDGEEVIELYVSNHVSKEDAIRSLKGFRRISLKAGESATISFTLGKDELSSRDNNGGYLPFKGNTLVSVGGCQPGENSLKNKQAVQASIHL